MHIGIGTKGGSFPITILLTFNIPFIFYDGIAIDRELPTLNNVIEVTNPDVDVTANDVEIPMLRSTTDALLVLTRTTNSENVDESTTGSASD